MKAGRKVCAKLETRIKELEGELDNEQRRLGDNTKSLRKYERRIKEIEFQVGQRAAPYRLGSKDNFHEHLSLKLQYSNSTVYEALSSINV